MKWNIVTDSSCDLLPMSRQNGNIQISSVPFTISIGNQDFVDDENLDTQKMLYAMEQEKSVSHTSCPSPNAWLTQFEKNCLFAEPVARIPAVRENGDTSSLKLWKGHEECEAHVTYSGKTIFLEFFHAISDGKGGMEFLTYLIAAYLSLRYCDKGILQKVIPIPRNRQLENGYRKYAKGFLTKKAHGSAFQIRGTPGNTKITDYCLPVIEIKRAAKIYGASINEFIAALLCRAITGIQREKHQERQQNRIRLLIPVNLRARFPCNTMRNFSLNVSLETSLKENGDLSRLCSKFHQYMQQATEPDKLAGQCASVSKVCDSGIVKWMPLSVKKWLVQTGLDFPLSGNTLTFSNMGETFWPEELKSRVETLGVVFSTKPNSPYSCAAISINGKLRLTLMRTILEPVLERQLEKILSAQCISFKKI